MPVAFLENIEKYTPSALGIAPKSLGFPGIRDIFRGRDTEI
jgi:hypothetical protein